MMRLIAIMHRALYAGCALAVMIVLTACAGTGRRPVNAAAPVAYQLGSIWVDPARQEISMTGFVNQAVGLIELLACGTAGKTHECAFVLYAKPVDIHAGLLLLGLKHGDPMPGIGEGPPQGDPVRIEVEWMKDDVSRRDAAELFLYDLKAKKPVRKTSWIFNGSMVRDGQYLAKMEDSFIATYWDPWAIINIGSELGKDDERVVINQDAIPPRHTPVRLIISPVKGVRP